MRAWQVISFAAIVIVVSGIVAGTIALSIVLGVLYREATYEAKTVDDPMKFKFPKPRTTETAEIYDNFNYVILSDGTGMKGDLFLPASWESATSNIPVFLLVHGGDWTNGRKEDMHETAAGIAANDQAALVVDYRLSPAFYFPSQVKDIFAGVSWIHHFATRFKLDTKNIFIWGVDQAGGHLALLAATAASNSSFYPIGTDYKSNWVKKYPRTAKAAIALGGITNFQTIVSQCKANVYCDWSATTETKVFPIVPCTVSSCSQKTWEELSPVSHLRPSSPAYFIGQKTEDPKVPFEQGLEFLEAVRSGLYSYIRYFEWSQIDSSESDSSSLESEIEDFVNHVLAQ